MDSKVYFVYKVNDTNAGADRCMMTLHFSYFLGTAPNPDVCKFVSGCFENASCRNQFHQFCANDIGVLRAEAKLCAVLGKTRSRVAGGNIIVNNSEQP